MGVIITSVRPLGVQIKTWYDTPLGVNFIGWWTRVYQ